MKMLNRSAISVQIKQPFLDWINQLSSNSEEHLSLEDVNEEATHYLVPELEDEQDLADFLDEFYVDIFENELFSWAEDSDLWPEQLNRADLDTYFSIKPAYMVFDLDPQAPLLASSL